MTHQLEIVYSSSSVQNEEDRHMIVELFSEYEKEIRLKDIELETLDDFQLISSADFLLLFEDRQLLEITNSASYLPPIFFVELPGSHSFFAEISIQQLHVTIDLLLNGSFSIEKELLISVELNGSSEVGLNDIYMTSSITNTRIRYDLLIDGEDIFKASDSTNGVLISTPVGSTAMAMNLGGALIHRKAQIFQFQAIASRNYLVKQRIVPATSEIVLKVRDANYPLLVQVDSRRYELDQSEFVITKSEHCISLVKVELETGNSMEHKLQQKLTLEDTADLTSSAKFILHILRKEDRGMKINEIMEITHLTNQKTIRNSLKLLIEKGFVRKVDNIEDMREHLYIFIDPVLTKFYS